MSYNIKGTLHKIGSTQRISDSFSKREFVIAFSDNPKYPQFAKMEATGDKCEALDDLRVGDEVSVEFNVRGRAYTSKKTGEEDYFNSLDAWKVERTSAAQTSGTSRQATTSGSDDDSLPF